VRIEGDEEGPQLDPWEVLGLEPGATDRQVSKAFLAAAKRYPPAEYPEEFERVQRAHQTLRDPVRRAEMELAKMKPRFSLKSLSGELSAVRKRIGVEPWLDLLRRDKG
jgi:curved DNA-binding protein CbpA